MVKHRKEVAIAYHQGKKLKAGGANMKTFNWQRKMSYQVVVPIILDIIDVT